MTILDEIIAYKKREVASCKELFSIKELEAKEFFSRDIYSLKASVLDPAKTGIIAEYKRQSPSKGVINNRDSVDFVTNAYTQGGASGLSVLTDFNYFGGTIEDLIAARKTNQIPILRKEFIVDEFQLIEAKAYGADAILLIAAVLTAAEIKVLFNAAHHLGLEVLLEVHTQEELEKINGHADLVGINNRNLKTFEVDIDNSIKLAKMLPKDLPKIAESGISSVDTINKLKKHGFDGFLIGENFMKAPNPAIAFNDFISKLKG
jgi:indole-3-glycerol phosphate synthase